MPVRHNPPPPLPAAPEPAELERLASASTDLRPGTPDHTASVLAIGAAAVREDAERLTRIPESVAEVEAVERAEHERRADRQALLGAHPLASPERRALLGLIPYTARSLWPDLDELNAAVDEAQQAHAEAFARVNVLSDQRATAPDDDARAHAAWFANGEQGGPPTPTTGRLDSQLRAATAKRDGLAIVLDEALERRADFVARHRARLAAVAAQEVEDAHARLVGLLDEIAAVREQLADVRMAEVWARTFPDPAAGQTPPTHRVALGLAGPVKDALRGIAVEVEFGRLLDLLRADAALVASMAPRSLVDEMRRAARGGVPDPESEGVWNHPDAYDHGAESPERAELRRVVAEYVREYGHEPDALQLEAYRQGIR